MTMGQLGMKHPSLAGMVTAIDARISRVALHYRFSEARGPGRSCAAGRTVTGIHTAWRYTHKGRASPCTSYVKRTLRNPRGLGAEPLLPRHSA